MISSQPDTLEVMEIWHCRVPPLTLTLVTMENTTNQLSNWTALVDQSALGVEELLGLVVGNDSSNASFPEDYDTGGLSCEEWEPAQHNLFQLANFFFAVAFMVPRNFKMSVLILRYINYVLLLHFTNSHNIKRLWIFNLPKE